MRKVARAPAGMSRAGRLGGTAGLSLTELLVVLAIMALMGGVAAAALRPGRDGHGSRAMAGELANALRQARARAVAGGGTERLVLDLEQRSYNEGDETTPSAFPSGTDIVFRTAASEIIRERTAAVRFFGDGTSTGGEIILSRHGRSSAVRVNWLTGAVTVRHDTPGAGGAGP